MAFSSRNCMCEIFRFTKGVYRTTELTRANSTLSTLKSTPRPLSFCSNQYSSVRYLTFSGILKTSDKSVSNPISGIKVSSKGLADEILQSKLGANKEEQESDEDKRKREEKAKADEFSKRAMKWSLAMLGLMFSGTSGYIVAAWGSPPIDEDGNFVEDEYSHLPAWRAYIGRTWREINHYDKMIKDPSRDKLLPDPLVEPYYQPPYTLVIEMTGVLVHPDWTYKTGWRFKKRPAVDFFLQQVGPPLFEVVVYTAEHGFTAFPILDSLDPNGYIWYRLFRDATRYLDGHHVKDLSCLNRDMSKVIFVDWNEKSFQLQPRNAVKLKRWKGNDDDRTLIDLAIFLRTIATSEIDDVRGVLDHYRQYDDPIDAFRANQRKAQEEQSRLQSEIKERQAPGLIGVGSTLGAMMFQKRR